MLEIVHLYGSVFKDREAVASVHPGPIGPVLDPLVELIGLEPTTYGLQSRRSPN